VPALRYPPRAVLPAYRREGEGGRSGAIGERDGVTVSADVAGEVDDGRVVAGKVFGDIL
jgi:hypothetical protein